MAFFFLGGLSAVPQARAQSVDWQSLSSRLDIAVSSPQRSRRSPDARVYVDITNSGAEVVEGNVRLLVKNLQPDSVSVIGLETTAQGQALSLSSLLGDGLAPGESLPRITLEIAGGGATSFTFDVDVQKGMTPPVFPTVHIETPASLSTLGASPVTVSGSVGPEAAVLTVNGMEVAHSDGEFSVDVALQEGHNTVVARAALGATQVTDSISLSLDMTPPYITLESHRDGDTVYTDKVTVSGLINDIVRGTIEAEQAGVSVNGIAATISNRSYAAENVPLQEGLNTLVIDAVDQVGNASSLSFQLTYKVPAQRWVEVLGGQSQQAVIGEILTEPLRVVVLDNDTPAAAVPVVFRVIQGSGAVGAGSAGEGRALVVETDAAGVAQTDFRLGARVGTANHKVKVAVVGYESEVVFNASATGRAGNKISVNSGNNQRGATGQVLPEPLVAVVTDSGANVVKDARVRFEVTVGGGALNGGALEDGVSVLEALTDSDGRAAAELVLGQLTGLDAQRVTATLIDAPEGQTITAGFTATAFVPADPGLTTISGVVLDNQDNPVPGVTLRVDGTSREAVADAAGRFLIEQAPVGPVHLIADGSTAAVGGVYPSLAYNIVTVAGVDNPLSAPIYMVKLNTEDAVYAGPEDVVLELAKYPGFKLEIARDSVTFPDGAREGYISVTPVNSSTVPMTPPNGMQPQFIVTIQPTNALFDPPARLTLPNIDGHTPGAQVEMYSFDHDLEEFVAIGLGTVSEDGSVVKSNPGVGIIKAGWHCGSQPGGSGCTHNCPECASCNAQCNCYWDNSLTPSSLTDTPGDCKKPGCQNGPTQVDDDTDAPADEPCKECSSGTLTDKPDSPAYTAPGPSAGPGATQVNADAVAMGAWGENTGFGYDFAVDCMQICQGGEEKFRSEGDITPSASWVVNIYTSIQTGACPLTPRTAANIARTTTHELKHTSFLMSVINGNKGTIGTVYDSEAACEAAVNSLESTLQTEWSAMVSQQGAHTDFSGEMRYGVDCVGGATVEVPTTPYP